MPDPAAIPVVRPSGAITEHLVAVADGNGLGAAVSATNPMPVAATLGAAGSTPLAGRTAASTVAGPFVPALGRAIWLALDGTWSGTAQVRRSVDGGATMQPLTAGGLAYASFTANANEPIGEESVAGASYYLAITLSSGTLAYRVQQ